MESAAFVLCRPVRHISSSPPVTLSLFYTVRFSLTPAIVQYICHYWQTVTEEEQGKKAKPFLLSGKECLL